jgi:hypothetical protein
MSHFESLEPFLHRLFRVSEAWGARLSPDRRQVAWIAGNLGPTAQLWLALADGSAPPRRWASAPICRQLARFFADAFER